MADEICLSRLTKEFRGRRVVDHLSLTVPAGAVYVLLGENGAGKSTTIKMLTGQLPADGGRATIGGVDCWTGAAELRRRVGYMPERPKLYDWMTVDEIGWFTAGFHRPGYLERYRELADQFELQRKQKLSSLSKGQYAKAALSLALAHDPEVLILDEPTSGLDLFVRRQFLASVVDLASGGRTVLIATHQIAEVERVASHVAFLSEGTLLYASTTDELRERIVGVRLRYEHEPPDAARLGRVLHRNGQGRDWYAVIQDLDRAALQSLCTQGSVSHIEERPLNLEEAYSALLGPQEASR